MIKNYSCVCHKKGENTTNILNYYFQNKCTLRYTKINIYIYRKMNLLLLKSIFLVWSSLQVKDSYKPKYNKSFFPMSEKKRLVNLQKLELQKTFSPASTLLVQLVSLFLIPCTGVNIF